MTKKYLIGNWYYCDEYLDYNELFINDSSIIWSPEGLPFGMYFTYLIKGDSAITKNQRGENGSYKVQIVNKNEMIQSWIDLKGKLHTNSVFRIKDSIITPFDKDKIINSSKKEGSFDELFISAFREREGKNECK